MKTTIDLPEELVLEAKKVGLARKLTLRAMVTRGLLREIRDPSPDQLTPIAALRGLDASIWSNTTADRYIEELREGWT